MIGHKQSYAWKGIAALALAALASTALPAAAQDDVSPTCGKQSADGWQSIARNFEGTWEMNHLAGYFNAGRLTMPFPASATTHGITLTYEDGKLVGSSPEAETPFVLERVTDEPAWTADTSGKLTPAPELTPNDAAMVAGCDQLQLPRLIAHMSVPVPNMAPLDFSFRFMAISFDQLYGIMHAHSTYRGTSVDAYRLVTLNKG